MWLLPTYTGAPGSGSENAQRNGADEEHRCDDSSEFQHLVSDHRPTPWVGVASLKSASRSGIQRMLTRGAAPAKHLARMCGATDDDFA